MRNLIFTLLIFVLIFSSCTKRLYYLQDVEADKNLTETEYQERNLSYKISEHDILRVNIKSINPEVTTYFNSMTGGATGSGNQSFNQIGRGGTNANFYFNGYTVNDTGYIELPIIGFVKVAEKTIPEATKYIQELADEYLEDAYVTVKFVSFKVTFLGEFGSPGTQVFYQEELNIYEAIERAGGITDYGNRQKVLVVRKTPEGRKTFYVNLQDRDILASEDLYLLPNDMLYAKPLGWRIFKVSSQDLLSVISTVTTLLTTTLLLINLGKNN